jgi:CRISPR/Cas system-associated exonuclease Cas4 (RecB family)
MKNMNKMIDDFQLYLKDLKPMELPVKVKKEVKALIKEVEAVKETIEDIIVPVKVKKEVKKTIKPSKELQATSKEVQKLEKKMHKLLYHGSNKMLYVRIYEDDAREIMNYAKEIQKLTKQPYPEFKITSDDKLVSIDTLRGIADGNIEIEIALDD